MTNRYHEMVMDEIFRNEQIDKMVKQKEEATAKVEIPKAALRKYNEIMSILCLEHNTIGEELSEGTENWNLRDMVAECDYTLSTYYEGGHCNCDMKEDGPEGRKAWISETGRLKRFIAHWEPYIANLKCAEGHCSRFDN